MAFSESSTASLCWDERLALLPALSNVDLVEQDSAQDAPVTKSQLAMDIRSAVKYAHSVNKNANGMLLLPPASSIIADDTKGPMKADVLPT